MNKFYQTISLLIVIIAFSTAVQSCNKKEGCTDPTADNYDPSAELENATCINAREKFAGVFLANDNCAFVQKNYVCEVIKANDNLTDIFILNIHNLNTSPVRARVNGSTFVIPPQQLPGFRRIEGSGSILGNQIQMNFVTKVGFGPNTPQNFEICNTTMNR
jgi:hypothetical protein